jgi:hypothetical protein
MKVLSAALILTIVFLSACSVLGSESWYKDYSRPQLMKRASFDMDCAENKLQDQPLSGYMTIGIKGCGKQTTYKYVDTLGWILNSTATR